MLGLHALCDSDSGGDEIADSHAQRGEDTIHVSWHPPLRDRAICDSGQDRFDGEKTKETHPEFPASVWAPQRGEIAMPEADMKWLRGNLAFALDVEPDYYNRLVQKYSARVVNDALHTTA